MSPLALTRTCSREHSFFFANTTREKLESRQVAYLNSFDDHLLSDIGLNRSEIEAYVRRRSAQTVG
jgi:uncharacterized protein YjiS (DUF1127 family)